MRKWGFHCKKTRTFATIIQIKMCFMNTKIFSILVVSALLICSCKSTKTTIPGSSPYLTEETSTTEVTVRTESVKLVDTSERTMYKYYVIIGSFSKVENARTEKANVAKKGFTPEILESESGLFRISVGGYDDESAARSKIAGIRAAFKEHSDVWLLIRKK